MEIPAAPAPILTGPTVPLSELIQDEYSKKPSPHHSDLDKLNFKPSSPIGEAEELISEEYLMALADALDHLPKVFKAGGKAGKIHKVI